MALWDVKGKRAGMPIYQLLGRLRVLSVGVFVSVISWSRRRA